MYVGTMKLREERPLVDIIHILLASRAEVSYSTRAMRMTVTLDLPVVHYQYLISYKLWFFVRSLTLYTRYPIVALGLVCKIPLLERGLAAARPSAHDERVYNDWPSGCIQPLSRVRARKCILHTMFDIRLYCFVQNN